MKRLLLGLLLVSVFMVKAATASTIYVVKGDFKPTDGGQVFDDVQKALKQAATELSQTGPQSVTIKIAAIEDKGPFDAGFVYLPLVKNPEGVFVIEGGYNATFTSRNPFVNFSKIVTNPKRNSAIFYFEKNSILKEVTISGLYLDAAPSNAYDAESNSLLPSKSVNHRLLEFNYLEANKVTIDSNVFLNSAMKGVTTLFRAQTEKAELHITNNFVMGNRVYGVDLATALGKNKPELCEVKNNTFVSNWGMNPEKTTSSSGGLHIANKDSCEKVVVEANIFAHNMYGAIDAKDKSLPPVTVKDNLFFNNNVFDAKGPGDTAVVGTVQGNVVSVEVEKIGDLMSGASGNIVADPELGMGEDVAKVKSEGSESVKEVDSTENKVRGILGLNKQGTSISISNFCPKIGIAAIPVPKDEKLRKYGVQMKF